MKFHPPLEYPGADPTNELLTNHRVARSAKFGSRTSPTSPHAAWAATAISCVEHLLLRACVPCAVGDPNI